MKAQKFTFDAPRIPTRAHRALFDDNTPFKPKSVKPKNGYQRRQKHRSRPVDIFSEDL